MWMFLTVLILLVEAGLLVSFIIGRAKKRNLNEALIFLGTAFAVTFLLHLVPFFYKLFVLGTGDNLVLGLLKSFNAALELFVGKPAPGEVEAFAAEVPLFSVAYLIGAGMAVLATVSAAVEAFGNQVRNSFRLRRVLKQPTCDLVVGCSPEALQYAQNSGAVLLLDNSVTKEAAVGLMEENFVVMRKGMSSRLMEDRRFNTTTRYNIICTQAELSLNCVDAFIAYKKAAPAERNVYLYVQSEGAKAEAVRREIIEKSGCEQWIDTFCAEELLARQFAEKHPITKFLPKEWIKDGAVRPDVRLHTFLLGFGPLSQELYRQSILNNQLVTFAEDTYKLLPVWYHIFDRDAEAEKWDGTELKQALAELNAAQYFPLPELPWEAQISDKSPDSRACLQAIRKALQVENSYGLVIIDTGSDFDSIELGAKLRRQLSDMDNFHIFVHSAESFAQDSGKITYYGKAQAVYTHDVIVNDSLSTMAKKLNEVYTAKQKRAERNRPDFAQYVQSEAEKAWNGFDYFTLYSNLYSAMSLRLKLNLLGLDYVADGKGENLTLLKGRYPSEESYSYDEHEKPSVRNALIAQEHARWNAYHLLEGYLPLAKDRITEKPSEGGRVRFQVKDTAAGYHACLTTYQGLSQLSAYLGEKAGCEAKEYDYYTYDEMLMNSAEELLGALGYSLIER